MTALYTKRYREALSHAARLHRNQTRKGTTVPYVTHLMRVSALVWEFGGDEDQAIAGLLHDAVEDAGGAKRLKQIRERYGKRVARIVWDCSDSTTPGKKRPWLERKTEHLEHLASVKTDTLLVVACDKVDNVEAVVADLQTSGRRVWERFNAPAEAQVWYSQSMFELLATRLGSEAPVVRRLDRGVGLLAVWAAVPRQSAQPRA